MSALLDVLVVDDERPALDELAFLLSRDDRVGTVTTAASASEALRVLGEGGGAVDAVFLDIAMPGLNGLELASVLGRFQVPPRIVFVTAHMEHAVDAFDLHAADYLLKPVREHRLREAVRRIGAAGPAGPDDETLAVELGGVTRFVHRSEVRYAEAQGDYVRLHTASGSHLVRVPISTLEERWSDAGFLRIHRSLLVALAHVDEIRVDGGRCSVLVGDTELQVSRRHTPALRERLRRVRQGSA
ncbi:MAG TPA: LytTR family DNA-binding domain-containing protein [Marmoricola sp.]|nr:LytTR family DNA-binding domain-containing protein [Marmoricola sp.]